MDARPHLQKGGGHPSLPKILKGGRVAAPRGQRATWTEPRGDVAVQCQPRGKICHVAATSRGSHPSWDGYQVSTIGSSPRIGYDLLFFNFFVMINQLFYITGYDGFN